MQLLISARDFQKIVTTPELLKETPPMSFAMMSSPMFETLLTNRQLMIRAELPSKRSMAEPVTCARFPRKTQFSIRTGF